MDYVKPEVTDYGTLEELTEFIGGGVHEDAHKKNPFHNFGTQPGV